MKMERALLKYFCMMGLLLMVPWQIAIAARTIIVDREGGGDFASIAEANADAQPGDSILIRSHSDKLFGNLKEGLVYASEGRIREPHLAIWDRKNVTLRGFWLEGLDIRDSENVTIEKCRVEMGAAHVSGSKNIVLRDSSFSTPDKPPFTIGIENSKKISLIGNLILGSWRGVVVNFSEVQLERNTIVNAKYAGEPLNPNDLADAHDYAIQGSAIFVDCGYDGKKASVALNGNIVAFNEGGLILEACKNKSVATLKNNIWHANAKSHYALVRKEYGGATFSYVLDELLSDREAAKTGNRFIDPLFNDRASGDYSLRRDSPALRLGPGGQPLGASADVATLRLAKNSAEVSPEYCTQETAAANVDGFYAESDDAMFRIFNIPIECCKRKPGSDEVDEIVGGDILFKWFVEDARNLRLDDGATLASAVAGDYPGRRETLRLKIKDPVAGLSGMAPLLWKDEARCAVGIAIKNDILARVVGRGVKRDAVNPDKMIGLKMTRKGLVSTAASIKRGGYFILFNEVGELAMQDGGSCIASLDILRDGKLYDRPFVLKGRWVRYRFDQPGEYLFRSWCVTQTSVVKMDPAMGEKILRVR